jgi:hypothetical protein
VHQHVSPRSRKPGVILDLLPSSDTFPKITRRVELVVTSRAGVILMATPAGRNGRGVPCGRVATSTWRVRSQPCSGCGGTVVVVQTRLSGLGGLWRIVPPDRAQHADFEPVGQRVDQIDADCRRAQRAQPDAPPS